MNCNEQRQLASRKPSEYYERVIRKVVYVRIGMSRRGITVLALLLIIIAVVIVVLFLVPYLRSAA